MSFFNRIEQAFHSFRGPGASDVQQLIKVIDQSADNKAILSKKIRATFQKSTEHLIGELIIDPKCRETWNEVGHRLKQIDPQLFDEFESPIHSIRKIASLLRKDNAEALQQFMFSNTGLHSLKVSNSAVTNFHFLHLPDDIDEVRQIAHPTLRTRVLANLINRDKIPLATLDLSKTEMMSIAPHLTHADCRQAFKAAAGWQTEEVQAFINRCSNATYLCISSTAITALPTLDKCTLLDCSGCRNLKTIPMLPECETLVCDHCSALKALPDLPKCTKLFCSHCPELTQLSGFNFVLEVDCRNCSHLKEINGFENVISLMCDNCTQLVRPPELLQCTALSCSECRNLDLKSLPMRFWPHLKFQSTFPVKVSELEQHPLSTLLKLGLNFTINNRVLLPIKFIEQDGRQAEGVDSGGLRRMFVSRLMKSLASQGVGEGQLPFEQEELGAMPIWDPAVNPIQQANQMKGFHYLGLFLGLCLQKQDVTGHVLNPELFQMLTSFRVEDLLDLPYTFQGNIPELPDELRIRFLASDSAESNRLFRPANLLQKPPSDLSEDEVSILIQIGNDGALFEETDQSRLNQQPLTSETREWLHATLKEYVLTLSKDRDVVFAAALIARPMMELLGIEGWEQLRALGAQGLQKKIQGVVTKEAVLEAIAWKASREGIEGDAVKKTKDEYVEKWINQANPQQLQDFLFVLTGSYALPPNKQLSLNFYRSGDPNKYPTVHTCYFEMFIPTDYPSYEHFKSKWEDLIAQSTNPEHSGSEET